jgi:hypothetical protein
MRSEDRIVGRKAGYFTGYQSSSLPVDSVCRKRNRNRRKNKACEALRRFCMA